MPLTLEKKNSRIGKTGRNALNGAFRHVDGTCIFGKVFGTRNSRRETPTAPGALCAQPARLSPRSQHRTAPRAAGLIFPVRTNPLFPALSPVAPDSTRGGFLFLRAAGRRQASAGARGVRRAPTWKWRKLCDNRKQKGRPGRRNQTGGAARRRMANRRPVRRKAYRRPHKACRFRAPPFRRRPRPAAAAAVRRKRRSGQCA